MIRMSVKGIGLDAHSAQPIVILRDQTDNRMLPIWIGMPEATAITFALEGTKSQRPMTHELLMNVIEELGYSVKHIEIDQFDDSAYRATMYLARKDRQAGTDSDSLASTQPVNDADKLIDARPSDAIAVALASGASIYVSQSVVDTRTYPIQTEKKSLPNAEEFRSFLEGVNASDFKIEGVSLPAPNGDQEDNSNTPSEPSD